MSSPSRFLFPAGPSSWSSLQKSFYRVEARRFRRIRPSHTFPKLALCWFAYARLTVRVLWFRCLVIIRMSASISSASSLLAPSSTSKHPTSAANLVLTILTVICRQLAMCSRGTLARLHACSMHRVSRLSAQTLPSCHHKYGEIRACGADRRRKT